MSPNLSGRVCVVTGATRGIGKGIAVQLGADGAKVYITGRTEGMLENCASEIWERGGHPVPVVLDHCDDIEVEKLFRRIEEEEKGRLDLLVLTFKNFFVRNLPIFVISLSVCLWQTLPAYYNVCGQGQEPTLEWSM